MLFSLQFTILAFLVEMYLVLFLTVFVDLITAVAAGVFFANLLTIKSLSDIQSGHVRAIVNPEEDDEDAHLSIAEKHLLNIFEIPSLLKKELMKYSFNYLGFFS